MNCSLTIYFLKNWFQTIYESPLHLFLKSQTGETQCFERLWHSRLPFREGTCGHMWSELRYMMQKHCGRENQWGMKLCRVCFGIQSFNPGNSAVCRDFFFCVQMFNEMSDAYNHWKLWLRGVCCHLQPFMHQYSLTDLSLQKRSQGSVCGDNMSRLCLWALVYDAQHDSGAPYWPATLTLPFSTFGPTERASLFSPGLVTSIQDHASISSSLPNNQGLWWSLIPTAYVVFT